MILKNPEFMWTDFIHNEYSYNIDNKVSYYLVPNRLIMVQILFIYRVVKLKWKIWVLMRGTLPASDYAGILTHFQLLFHFCTP